MYIYIYKYRQNVFSIFIYCEYLAARFPPPYVLPSSCYCFANHFSQNLDLARKH